MKKGINTFQPACPAFENILNHDAHTSKQNSPITPEIIIKYNSGIPKSVGSSTFSSNSAELFFDCLRIPPDIDSTVSTLKDEGGVISYVISISLVVSSTNSPAFPAISLNSSAIEITPSVSSSVNTW